MMFDLENSAREDLFVVASQTFVVVALMLRFVFSFVVEFSPAQVHEIAAVVSDLTSDADEHQENVSPNVVDDGTSFPQQHLYFDKFDRDILIERMIDAAGMLFYEAMDLGGCLSY